MKIQSVVMSAILVMSILSPGATRANPRPTATTQAALSAQPLTIPSTLQAQINAAIAACNCFDTVAAWKVAPIAPAAQVFASEDVLFSILDLDLQLPWVAAGEINSAALAVRLASSGQKALISNISAFADPSGGPFRLGAYAWSHPTQPDFCSGETLYLMYFERTGVLFSFRFDSSHEC